MTKKNSEDQPKDIFYIEIDDEIADLCDFFRETKKKEVVLVFPKHSPLLLSKINIKLLLEQAEKAKKKLFFISRDPIAMKHLKDLKQIVWSKLSELGVKEEHTENQENDTHEPEEKKGFSIQEVFKKIPKPKLPHPGEPDMGPKYQFSLGAPGKKFLSLLVVLSLALFLFIGYIAIPGATVYIDPQVTSLTRSLNILFVDTTKQDLTQFQERVVQMYPLDIVFERDVTIGSTGQVFRGQNAKGTVTIYNMDTKIRPIIQGSRLQTQEGLLFLTDSYVDVPAKNGEDPGTIQVAVTAAEEDAYDSVMGERGNVGPTVFFFPGLSEESRKILWADSSTEMTGGVTEVDKFVQPEDLEAARAKVEQELRYYAISELKERIEDINKEQGTHYVLFDKMDRQERIISKELLEVNVPEVANEPLVSFDAYGKMHTKGWYYDRNEVYGIMKRHMEERLSPSENLIKIDDTTMKFTTLFEDELDMNRGLIKATVSIEGIISYNFFDTRTTLIRTIKQSIIGKSKFEAETEINNLPQVKDVHITTWPFWAPTLPTISDNIEIKINEIE